MKAIKYLKTCLSVLCAQSAWDVELTDCRPVDADPVDVELEGSVREWEALRSISCCRLRQAQEPLFHAALAAYSHILDGSLTVSAV
jgi:hypothetical protein